MQNANPLVFEPVTTKRAITTAELDESIVDRVDAREVFDHIRNINDPEHPLTLEQLNVVRPDHVWVESGARGIHRVRVEFTPTIPHCSMSTLIGLSIHVCLLRSLPREYKVSVEFVNPSGC